MAPNTIRKRHNASTITASVGLLAALAPAVQAAPLAPAPAPALPTRLKTAYTTATSTATPTPTSGGTHFCLPEDVLGLTKPPPCGPIKIEEEYAEFMRCMNDPEQCKDTALERDRIATVCTRHPTMPACESFPLRTPARDVEVESVNPIGDLITHIRCANDPNLPECQVLGVAADIKGYVVPEKMAMVPAPEKEERHIVKRGIRINPFAKCPLGQ